jgi:flagellar FliL protein
MADDDLDEDELDDDEEGEDGDEDEDGEGSSGGGKKKLIIIIAAIVLLVIGGAGAAFFMGLFDPLLGGEEQTETKDGEGGEGGEEVPTGPAVFYDLPEMLVNLNTGDRKATFLKIKVSLEVSTPEDIPKLQALMPRIIDNFQVYLRELRIDDLKGSAGMYRLREELLTRVNAAIAPAKVRAVLFKEMLVQ